MLGVAAVASRHEHERGGASQRRMKNAVNKITAMSALRGSRDLSSQEKDDIDVEWRGERHLHHSLHYKKRLTPLKGMFTPKSALL